MPDSDQDQNQKNPVGAGINAAQKAQNLRQGAKALKTAATIGKTALRGTGVGNAFVLATDLTTTKTGRKILIGGILAGCGCLLTFLALPIIIIFIIIVAVTGTGTGEAAGLGNSPILTVSKTANPTAIAKDTANAPVTYTITVSNKSDKEATNITVTDVFSSSPENSFASEITGYEPSYSLASLAAGVSDTKTFTAAIPHTDFDPGWTLINRAAVSGTIDGKVESSTSGATVIIGNPPTGPPSFSPLHNPDKSGGYGFGQTVVNSQGQTSTHQGLDIHDDSDRSVLSPFAQAAVVTLNTFDQGYGYYVILQSGEWEAYLTHLESQSSLSVGQTVDSSTLVGIMDCTGYFQGAQLL